MHSFGMYFTKLYIKHNIYIKPRFTECKILKTTTTLHYIYLMASFTGQPG